HALLAPLHLRALEDAQPLLDPHLVRQCRALDLPLLDADERLTQLTDLVLASLVEGVAVPRVEGGNPLEGQPATLVGLDRLRVAAERHLRLAEAVVGDREVRIELDRLPEEGGRLLVRLRAQELLAAAIRLLRVAALLLVEGRGGGGRTD